MAVRVAYRPDTPTWYSDSPSQPFIGRVVASSAPIRSASRVIASPAPAAAAPCPATITGFLLVADDAGRLAQQVWVRLDTLAAGQQRGGRLVLVDVAVVVLRLDVHRRVQHDRAGLDAGAVERRPHGLLGLACLPDGHEAGLGRVDEPGLVELLHAFRVVERGVAGEDDHRHLGAGGDDQRGGELAQAWALRDGADARLARGARPALGHRQRRALVARLVDRDVRVLVEGVPPVHVAVAHQAENGGHALLHEGARQRVGYLHPAVCTLQRRCPACCTTSARAADYPSATVRAIYRASPLWRQLERRDRRE